MPHTKSHLDGLSIILLTVLCASWGLQQVAIKLSAADIAPIVQSSIRSGGAMVLVGLWVFLRRKPMFEKDGTLWWGIAAGLLFSFEFVLVYFGLEYTNASRAIIFLYMSPFVVALGSQFFIPTEKLTRLQYIGLISSFIGILVAFGESFTFPSQDMLIGDCMLIIAAIAWGATTVVIKMGPLAKASSSKTLLYQLSVSALIMPIAAWISGETWVDIHFTPVAVASVAYQTIWIATFTFIVWFWLIRIYPAPKLASFSFLTPFFGVLAGGLILDEPMTPALLIAMVMVGIGIYLVNRKHTPVVV